MHYIVQENVFRDQHYNLLFDALKRLNLEYTVVRVFPFEEEKVVRVDDIPVIFQVDELKDFNPEFKNVFVFGGLKIARIGIKKNWTPGSFMNENHDFEVYSQYYKNHLLNYNSIIQTVSGKIEWLAREQKFIRPTKDTKSFTGKVFNETDWTEFYENAMENKQSILFNKDTVIQITNSKPIYKEIRFWVVDGKIITGSQYKIGNQTQYDSVYENEAQAFAQSMVDLYQVADAFVIDICLTDNGWKIVECNCINCAGFYKADLQKLLIALEDKFNYEKEIS